MLFTLLNIFLGVGLWPIETSQYALNVTLRTTTDNRIQYDTVLFVDNKLCTVLENAKYVIFNSEEDAMNIWNTNYAQNQIKRYEQRWHISTNECNAFDKDIAPVTISLIILSIAGTFVDIIIYCLYKRYKQMNHLNPIPSRQMNQVLPQNTEPLIELVPQDKNHPQKLDQYVAQLIADAQLSKGELCPISQEQLNKAALLVPHCGHVISETSVSANPPKKCCICKRDIIYTRVEASLTVIKDNPAVGNDSPV